MAARRRERWYSMEGQRRIHRSALESTKGPRHLISLVVLLALTLIAMRQVSDPKRVGRVASAVGLLPSPSSGAPLQNTSPVEEQTLGGDPSAEAKASWTLVSTDPGIEFQAQVLGRLLDTAPASVVSNLALEYLIPKDPDTPKDPESSAIALSEKELKERVEWFDASKKQVMRWTELSESTAPEHAFLARVWKLLDELSEPIVDGQQKSSEIEDSLEGFQLALDRALLAQFADNTPWRSSDRVPLMRTTQRAVDIGEVMAKGELMPEVLPSIAIPQLMGDTDSLRGRVIRISGRIALVDRAASMSGTDRRISDYGVIWLRPEDGSNQPIIVHVPKILGFPAEELQQDRSIIVSGIVAKRRAYASNRGGEIAPVVVASNIQPFIPGAQKDSAGSTDEQKKRAATWQRPLPTKRWTPPADISGAIERIEQRIGARVGPLETRISEESLPDPSAIDALARNEVVQATLDGLMRVIDEVQLVANPKGQGRNPKAIRIRSCCGWVTQVRPITIEKEPFPGWQWKELYACSLETISSDDRITKYTIITQHVPSQWLRVSELRQPAIATGLTFDVDGTIDVDGTNRTAAHALMISPAVEWRIETDAASIGGLSTRTSLPAGWATLLERGWSLDWIDTIEGLQGKPMTARESKAFYSLLRCSKQPLDAGQVENDPSGKSQTLSVMESIQRAETRKSKRDAIREDSESAGYRVKGVAEIRRIQRVDVRNPDEQEWLGADHYFQLDGFADIGNSRITIRYDDSVEPIVFEKEFPVTLVALNVPDSLLVDAGDAIPGEAQAWYPRSRVSVSGWFYRMWRFKTTQVSEATNDKDAQQGPLLVIDRFDTPPARQVPGASNASPQWVAITTMAIGILGGLWILRQIRHGLQRGRPKRR